MTSSKVQSPKPKAQAPTQRGLDEWASTAARVANITQLHDQTGFDRATIAAKLKAAGLRPVREGARLKQFDEQKALEVLTAEPSRPAPLTHARTQKTQAEAARIVLKLKREQGDLAPRSEFREEAYNLVKAMHSRLTRYARDSRRRLKLKPEHARQMETDIALIFAELKQDYPEILPGGTG